MFNKRINIFTGHFGSGKTEVAVNYAVKLAGMGKKTAIVDFDIVNPYFRTTDAKPELESHGIKVITPLYANTNVDVPALPPEINTLFENREYTAVFDVGGDDLGARAVSRFRDRIVHEDYEMFFVINARRPMTDSASKMKDMIRSIEDSARLNVTSLVNNTNLLEYTTENDILEGQKLIEAVGKELNLPVAFISVIKEVVPNFDEIPSTPIFSMDKFIRLPWDR